MIRLAAPCGEIEIVDEPMYTFGSADNGRRYPNEVGWAAPNRPHLAHGVLLNGDPLAVFGESRCIRLHVHSALVVGDVVHLAVGGHVVCFRPEPFEVLWALEVDAACCFGVHHCAERGAMLAHGELDITRYSPDGKIVWQSGGADIFSEGFALQAEAVEAVDFDGRRYRFNYDTGEPLA